MQHRLIWTLLLCYEKHSWLLLLPLCCQIRPVLLLLLLLLVLW